MADYLVKIQQQKIDLGNRLRNIRHQNNISLESIGKVFPESVARTIEEGESITVNGEIITVDLLLGYCDLINAGIGPYNLTPEE